MNIRLFSLINHFARQNGFCDNLMVIISKYAVYVYIAAVACIFLAGIVRKNAEQRKIAVNTAILTMLNLFLSFVLSAVFYVERPFVRHKVTLLYPHAADSSFPSDHATGTMSIALGLWRQGRALGAASTVLSFIVGFSRVYVGHHYPADIIGSYAIVAGMNVLYNLLLRKWIDAVYDKVDAMFLKKGGKVRATNSRNHASVKGNNYR